MRPPSHHCARNDSGWRSTRSLKSASSLAHTVELRAAVHGRTDHADREDDRTVAARRRSVGTTERIPTRASATPTLGR